MTSAQTPSIGIMVLTIGLFLWSRWPKELIAASALLLATLIGVVPAAKAFTGFGTDAVVLLASVFLLSAAIARSGVIEVAVRPLLRRLHGEKAQLLILQSTAVLLSALVRDSSVIRMMLPIAAQASARTRVARGALMMPIAFASLAGGLLTLVGNPANVVVSQFRGQATGTTFRLFDFAPVGIGVAVAALAFLILASWLRPVNGRGLIGSDFTNDRRRYTAEARVPANSPFVAASVEALETAVENSVRVGTIVRERFRRIEPTAARLLQEGDHLLLVGEPDDLERLISVAQLSLQGATRTQDADADAGADMVMETVVTIGSPLVGETADTATLKAKNGLEVLAISRRGAAIARRLRYVRFQAGDVLILKGAQEQLREAARTLRVLPLSDRSIALGSKRRSFVPIAVVAGAVALVTAGALPAIIAFAAAAVAVLLLRGVGEVGGDWTIIVILAALTPVAEAVRASGGSALMASGLSGLLAPFPPFVAIVALMTIAIALASLSDGVVAVLILAPVAAALATRVGLNLDAALMAVAVGAGCTFLSPAATAGGALVRDAVGYRTRDFWRLGLPLTLIAIAVATPLIGLVWGFGAA